MLAQDNPRTRLRRHPRSLQARRTSADDDHVSVLVVGVVAADVGRLVRLTQASRTADHRLDQAVPHGRADQESLVVEARREEPRQRGVHRANVEVQVREGVDRLGGQALAQLGHRHAVVGFTRAFLGVGDVAVDERVWLFHASGNDAARAVVLERTTHQMHAVGQQRRGHRVTAIAREGLAVEGKAQRLGTVDATAGREAIFLAHAQPSPRS